MKPPEAARSPEKADARQKRGFSFAAASAFRASAPSASSIYI